MIIYVFITCLVCIFKRNCLGKIKTNIQYISAIYAHASMFYPFINVASTEKFLYILIHMHFHKSQLYGKRVYLKTGGWNTATVWQFWHLSGRHLCLRIFRRLVCASVGFTVCLYNLPLAVVPTQILVLHLTLHASVTYTNMDWWLICQGCQYWYKFYDAVDRLKSNMNFAIHTFHIS